MSTPLWSVVSQHEPTLLHLARRTPSVIPTGLCSSACVQHGEGGWWFPSSPFLIVSLLSLIPFFPTLSWEAAGLCPPGSTLLPVQHQHLSSAASCTAQTCCTSLLEAPECEQDWCCRHPSRERCEPLQRLLTSEKQCPRCTEILNAAGMEQSW